MADPGDGVSTFGGADQAGNVGGADQAGNVGGADQAGTVVGADQAGIHIGESPDIPLAAAAEAWLGRGLAAEPADRPAAEAAVRLAYQLTGLPAPERFVWQDSPRAGAIAAARLTGAGETGRSVRPQVRTKAWADARARQTARLGAAGWAQHWAASGARTWQLLNERIVTPLRTRLAAELTVTGEGASATSERSEPGSREPGLSESELTDKELAAARLTLLDAVHGQHDGAWLAAFGGADQAGNVDDDAALAGLAGVARSAGWWWPYERVVILTERPLAVHRDNLGRLHHGDGPALSYPDGWGLHAWRGMPIPAAVAAQLPHLTVEQIRDEANAEVRRVMLEHFGFDRYLQASGARELGRDESGILWRVELERDEPLVMVEVVNSTPEPDGTSRTYFLRVPPNIRTARAGVAWTFGLTEEEYHPLTQT
jgi:Domain of unknown function (DUF6745)